MLNFRINKILQEIVMKKKNIFTVFLLIVSFSYCYCDQNNFKQYFEPYTIEYLQGYYPIPNNILGMDMFVFPQEGETCVNENMELRLTEQQKQAIWQKCLSHQRAAQANVEAAERQSIMIPDRPKRELMTTAIKTLVTSMAGKSIKEKAVAVAVTLAAEYLASIYEQYDKVQVYLTAAEEQYRLAGQCLDILGCDR